MLARLERQKEIGDKLPEFRHTFEEFVRGGQREEQPGFFISPRYWWSRKEKLAHNGQEFTLSVATTSDASELQDAELSIQISADDGRKEGEILPPPGRSQKIAPQEMLKILDRLSDLEAVVRKFNRESSPSN
jgi:hypothetical protein